MNHWLRDTLIGLLFVVPAILAISFFRRIFNISAEVFIPWYYLGITATLFISTLVSGESLGKFIHQPKWVILGMILVGLTVGAGANIFTFRAYANSPNPGVVQAIQEAAVPLIFLSTLLLSYLLPKYFSTGGSVNVWWSLAGITLTLVGVLMLIFKSVE